jgi:hypothetical protein
MNARFETGARASSVHPARLEGKHFGRDAETNTLEACAPIMNDNLARDIHDLDRGGEGGIRTLGTLLGYGALAKRCFRPLSHLTKRPREYDEQLAIANGTLLIAEC